MKYVLFVWENAACILAKRTESQKLNTGNLENFTWQKAILEKYCKSLGLDESVWWKNTHPRAPWVKKQPPMRPVGKKQPPTRPVGKKTPTHAPRG